MVDGTAPGVTAVPAGAFQPGAPAAGASTEATCVTPTLNDFAASPNPVGYGGSVTLSWSASSPNPLSCNVSSSLGGVTGGASGSWTIGPVTAQTYFELYCWDAYGDGNTAGVTVSVAGGGGGPWASTPIGWLDSVGSGGLASGWSCDGDAYGVSIYVQVYADGAFVAQSLASVNRPDVAAATWACNGTGNHGFAYQLPGYLLDGQPHTIKVVGVNVDSNGGVVGSGNAELSGSPMTVTPGAPATLPTISAWSASPNGVWSGSTTVLSWSTDAASCSIGSSPSGGSWSGLPGSGSITTPALAAAYYSYTLRCANGAGSVSKSVDVEVEDADDGSYSTGHATIDGSRTLASVDGCKWKGEENWVNRNSFKGVIGVRWTFYTLVQWCVTKGQIRNVTRQSWTSTPATGWSFAGFSSTGPCSQTCGDYVTLYGTHQTSKNIWIQGRYQFCLNFPLVGAVYCKDDHPIVGVLIRGDGTRVDTYAP
jgi:hypothetical protein